MELVSVFTFLQKPEIWIFPAVTTVLPDPALRDLCYKANIKLPAAWSVTCFLLIPYYKIAVRIQTRCIFGYATYISSVILHPFLWWFGFLPEFLYLFFIALLSFFDISHLIGLEGWYKWHYITKYVEVMQLLHVSQAISVWVPTLAKIVTLNTVYSSHSAIFIS